MTADREAWIRLGSFIGVLTAMSVWEMLTPRRSPRPGQWIRKGSHLALVVLNTVAARVALPMTAVGAALFAESRDWGLLRLCDWPEWAEFAIAVAALDLAIYLQHVMFHAVPAFWRLHRTHHADPEFDSTTGIRFHPLEILLSAFIKLGGVLLLGPSAGAVIAFEVLLNGTAMFNHGNVRLPESVDRVLRWVIVTPDMHRVHHSILRPETDSNFGFNLPWWDYLLGTYRREPRDGHERMQIGLPGFPDDRQTTRLPGILRLPFAREARSGETSEN